LDIDSGVVGDEFWVGHVEATAEIPSVLVEGETSSAQRVALLAVLVVLDDDGEEGLRLVFLTLGDASGVGGKAVMA
jgi:hypothetical protein